MERRRRPLPKLLGLQAFEATARLGSVSRAATELFLKGKPDALVEHLAKAAPLERLGTPEDIASVVAFLAGPDGGWVNGQVLRANGGMV